MKSLLWKMLLIKDGVVFHRVFRNSYPGES